MGVVTATFFLFDWNDWVDAVDETPNIFEEDEKDPHDFAAIRNALGVTAVGSNTVCGTFAVV